MACQLGSPRYKTRTAGALFSDSAVRWLGSRSTDKLPRHNSDSSFHKIIMTFIFPASFTKCLCIVQTMFDHGHKHYNTKLSSSRLH